MKKISGLFCLLAIWVLFSGFTGFSPFPGRGANLSGCTNVDGNLTCTKFVGSGSGLTGVAVDNMTVADTNDTTSYVALWQSATGSQKPKSDQALTYNATTGTLGATYFTGDGSALTGVGSTAATSLTFTAKVNEGAGIKKGQAVYLSGATGALPQVSLANNTTLGTTRVIGLAAETKANSQNILIRRSGTLSAVTVDTNVGTDYGSWAAGDLLFLSGTSGKMTKTRPTSGRSVKVAYVLETAGASDLLVVPLENPVWVTAAADENATIRLGDSAGVNVLSIRDYANDTVAKINSDGAASFGAVTGTSFTTTRADAAQSLTLYEASSDSGNNYATLTVPAKGTGLTANSVFTLGNTSLSFTGTFNDGKLCNYTASGNVIACNSEASGSGTMTTVKEGHDLIGAADMVAIDFGPGFDVADNGTIAEVTLDLMEYTGGVQTDHTNGITIGTTGVQITSDNDGAITFTGKSAGYDEDLTINLDDTENTAVFSSSTGVTKLDFSALNLVSTGFIQGGINVDSDANGEDNETMNTAGAYGTLFIATGSGTWVLPNAKKGMSLCLMDSGTAHDLILDVSVDSTIRLKGTEQAAGVGVTNASGSTTGDFICVVAVADWKWSTMGMQGTWASQ